jgi:hypothetical protein
MKDFYVESNKKVTKLSGGRKHFSFRPLIAVDDTYVIVTKFGENPYSLAEKILKSDLFWWVISDINVSKDSFTYNSGDEIILPKNIVTDSYSTLTIW